VQSDKPRDFTAAALKTLIELTEVTAAALVAAVTVSEMELCQRGRQLLWVLASRHSAL